jgi:signal transduction histidine kinase
MNMPPRHADIPMKERIAYRQVRVIVLAAVLLGIIFGLIQIVLDYRTQKSELSAIASQVISTMRQPAGAAAFEYDSALASQVADGLFEYQPITRVQLIDDTGSVLIDRKRDTSEIVQTKLARTLFGDQIEHKVELVDFKTAGNTVGRMVVLIDPTSMAAAFIDRAIVILTTGILRNAILAGFLFALVYFMMTKPLLNVVRQIANIDPENPAQAPLMPSAGHERDEFRVLTDSTNDILHAIAENLKIRTQTEDKLKRQNQIIEVTIENMELGVTMVNSDLEMTACNSRFREICGFPEEQFPVGTPLASFFRALSERGEYGLGDVEDQVQTRMELARQMVAHHFERTRPNGVVMEIRGRPLDDGGFVSTYEDISERKRDEIALLQAKEEAEIASRTKSDFLANVSHELRTPLNGIIGFSEIIEEEIFGPFGNDRYKSYVSDIKVAGHHLLDLINDILDVAKIEAGALNIVSEPVSVAAVIGSSLKLLNRQAAEKSQVLNVEVAKNLPQLLGDRLRLSQVVINLLSNAIKFTPDEGEISINAKLENGDLLISVRDSGIGIAQHEIERIFQPFQQIGQIHTRNHEGSGLGLALVRSLVELHDGTAHIESELGVGTTVTIRFPKTRLTNKPDPREKT